MILRITKTQLWIGKLPVFKKALVLLLLVLLSTASLLNADVGYTKAVARTPSNNTHNQAGTTNNIQQQAQPSRNNQQQAQPTTNTTKQAKPTQPRKIKQEQAMAYASGDHKYWCYDPPLSQA
ncbi:unnamed protein product [Absidia cylindrospora]